MTTPTTTPTDAMDELSASIERSPIHRPTPTTTPADPRPGDAAAVTPAELDAIEAVLFFVQDDVLPARRQQLAEEAKEYDERQRSSLAHDRDYPWVYAHETTERRRRELVTSVEDMLRAGWTASERLAALTGTPAPAAGGWVPVGKDVPGGFAFWYVPIRDRVNPHVDHEIFYARPDDDGTLRDVFGDDLGWSADQATHRMAVELPAPPAGAATSAATPAAGDAAGG